MRQQLIYFFLFFTFYLNAQTDYRIDNEIKGDANSNYFGDAVAITADGKTIISGANDTGNDSYAEVYTLVNNKWVVKGNRITIPDALAHLSHSVSISDDGNIIAVSAPTAGNLDNGVVKVFQFNQDDNTWNQIGNDFIGDAWFDELGHKVSLSSDGTILAISSILNDANGSKAGQIKVFKYDENTTTWNLLGIPILGEAANDQFGYSMQLSSDGTIFAAGSKEDYIKVYEYDQNTTTWSLLGNKIYLQNKNIGDFLSLSSDGKTVAFKHNITSNQYNTKVYEFKNGNWNQKGADLPVISKASLALNGSVLAGTTKNKKNEVTIYKFENDSWVNKLTLKTSWSNAELNTNVLSEDASTFVVGDKFGDTSDGNNKGIVSAYDLNHLTLSVKNQHIIQATVYPNPAINNIIVSLNTKFKIKELTLYNVLGKTVATTTNNKLNVKNLATGVYFLEVNTNRGKTVKKIIKK